MSIKELSVYKVNPLGIVAGIVLIAIAIICLVVLSASTGLNNKSGSYDQGTCWNKVIDYGRGTSTNMYYWPDGCKGQKSRSDRFCTMALVVLTPEETKQYEAWKSAGSVVTSACK